MNTETKKDRVEQLREALATLKKFDNDLEPMPTNDPFELVLLENVAYLSNPSRRRKAFEELGQNVGFSPEDLLAVSRQTLEKITAHGILKAAFVSKLKKCASILLDKFGGDLHSILSGPTASAKKALRAFPGIGEPGADKIMLFSELLPVFTLESNGLRTLVRLGIIADNKSYARMYHAAKDLGAGLGSDLTFFQEAHLLLQNHGRTLCKRSNPKCGECPLFEKCRFSGKTLSNM